MNCLLGIDVGTTGTKTVLFQADGRVCAHAYRPYPTSAPNPGWREQNPEHWWQAIVETVREVCQNAAVSYPVSAISLSTQGGTLIPVDHNLCPVRPAIVWSDERCAEEHEAYLREVGSAESMYEKTGWHLGRSMNALQIRWLRTHEPAHFRTTAMFLSVPDYVSMKMTGVAAIDLSNAGINQLADIRTGRYDPELLHFCGITEQQLPRLVSSGTPIGHLTPQAAEALGLSTETILTAGAHDQYAAALGAGLSRDGDILIGSGTCWVVTALNSQPDFHSGLSQSVSAVAGKWGSLCSLSSGGVCLDWLRRNLTGAEGASGLSYADINAEAAKRRAAESGLFFYPFSGQATHRKNFSRATFVGLDLSHDRFDLARAIMEGVVFQALWMMERFPAKPSSEGLKLVGGACNSELWCQLLADCSGLPVRIPNLSDIACVGAAILAGCGCGLYPDAERAYEHFSVQECTIYPEPAQSIAYRALFSQYKQIAAKLFAAYTPS